MPPVGYSAVERTDMPEWKPAIERCIEGVPELEMAAYGSAPGLLKRYAQALSKKLLH